MRRWGRPPVGFRPLAIGLGAGSKDFPGHPNVVRVVIGEVPPQQQQGGGGTTLPQPLAPLKPASDGHAHSHHSHGHGHDHDHGHGGGEGTAAAAAAGEEEDEEEEDWRGKHDWLVEELCVVECNLDDITGEAVGYASAALFARGALDVWTVASTAKKSRPALVLHCLCRPAQRAAVLEALFSETTSLGVRVRPVERCSLRRSVRTISVTLPGAAQSPLTSEPAAAAAAPPTTSCEIRCKVATLDGRVVNAKPEFEDCAAIARQHPGLTLHAVQRAAQVAAADILGGSGS